MKKLGMWTMSMSLLALAACSSSESPSGAYSQSNSQIPSKETAAKSVKQEEQPVKLTIYLWQPLDDKEFNTLLVEPLKKKYPYITLEPIRLGKGQNNLAELIASGIVPDLVTQFNGYIPSMRQLDVLEDITPLLKQHSIDLSRFEPAILDAIRINSEKGELYGLPYSVQFSATYYNKDIFDKFGVGYPQDGMYWEDAIELAQKLTRMDGSTQYRGLNYEHMSRLSSAYGLDIVNGKTDRANLDIPTWRQVFELGKTIYSIPGNRPPNVEGDAYNLFFKERNTAMLTTVNVFNMVADAAKEGVNLDVAQYPSYRDRPNTYGLVDSHYLLILKQSKNKEAAAKVLEVITSDEVQLASAQQLVKLSPLTNPAMKQNFGAGNPAFEGMHISSIFKSKPAPAPFFSVYYPEGRTVLSAIAKDFVMGSKDVNTALREGNEALNQKITSVKGQ